MNSLINLSGNYPEGVKIFVFLISCSIPHQNNKTMTTNEQKFDVQNIEHLNKILNYNNKTVRIFGTNEDPWFCGRDVCDILEYSDYRGALFDNVETENKKSLKELGVGLKLSPKITHNEGQMAYINKQGLQQLLLKSRTVRPSVIKGFLELPFIKKLNFNMNIKITFKEQDCIGAIIDAYQDTKCFQQFTVGPYRVDLYMPEYNLSIECDEHNHKNRDPEYEKERQQYIENELKCVFFRFNPDSKDFNIFKLIRNICDVIKNEEMKKKDEEMKKLKIENKFLEGFYNAIHQKSEEEDADSIG